MSKPSEKKEEGIVKYLDHSDLSNLSRDQKGVMDPGVVPGVPLVPKVQSRTRRAWR